jgi:hypothetical protein
MSGLTCVKDLRREEVRRETRLAGLDFLETGANAAELRVYFLGRAPDLGTDNIAIEGGARVRGIRALSVSITRSYIPDFDDFMDVKLDREGDFSVYTFRVVSRGPDGEILPHPAFDPCYSALDFSFKLDCPNEFDCKSEAVCPPPARVAPEINYLAKDYESFRQVIFDRLALLMPEWTERHVPDFGVALVELLAYTGDYLSYYQDAAATEAYLDTARLRISVRRHVRLVDYRMHEGCNARAWITVEAIGDPEVDLGDIYVITNANESIAAVGPVTTEQLLLEYTGQLPPGSYEIFEPVVQQKVKLHEAQNEIHFYTWRKAECCLSKGATSATLIAGKDGLQLQPGDVLIFEEVLGPVTGAAADADPAHRHAVRLTSVADSIDPLNQTAIVEIAWRQEDALPFPLCISALLPAPQCELLENISVARGNVILVDHGAPVQEDPGVVPPGETRQECGCNNLPGEVTLIAGKFQPRLKSRPLTFRQPYDAQAPAVQALTQDPHQAGPVLALAAIPGGPDGGGPLYEWGDIANPAALLSRLKAGQPSRTSLVLLSQLSAETRSALAAYDPSQPAPEALLKLLTRDLQALLRWWSPVPDLLDAFADDLRFVAEMDNDGYAHLRFGDGDLGASPVPGTLFHARYRIGNGPAGNVGANSLTTLVTRTITLNGAVRKARNPMPAAGGIAPQPLDEVKMLAPFTFRADLQRAIVASDYAVITLRDFAAKLQNAAATLRWTGSGYEALVVVDPIGREAPDPALLEAIAAHLERYRRIGHDVVVQAAVRVPVELEIGICVLPHFRPDAVKRAVLDLFSNRVLPDGRKGFFHPDNLTFGQGIYLSRVIALAQSAPGVLSVQVKVFQRYRQPATSALDSGVLKLGALEIAQADNDPNYPEHGKVEVTVL